MIYRIYLIRLALLLLFVATLGWPVIRRAAKTANNVFSLWDDDVKAAAA